MWRTLAPPTVRALPIVPPLAMAAIAVAVVAYGRVRSPGLIATEHLLQTRVAMVLLAAGAGFSLDDPSEPTVAGAPVALCERRAVRLVLTVALWAAGWLGVAVAVATAGGSFPVAALTLEAAAWLCICLAVASSLGGAATGVSLLGVAVLLFRLPDRWSIYAPPGAPDWGDAHLRWLAMLAIAATIVVLASRDPARRRGVAHQVRNARADSGR